jgi:hypothetical protein
MHRIRNEAVVPDADGSIRLRKEPDEEEDEEEDDREKEKEDDEGNDEGYSE